MWRLHTLRPALLSALLWLCLASIVVAQGVTASVNSSQVPLDSQVELTVVIEGTQNAQPRLPDLSDFRVVSRGGSSREMSIVNGAMTQRVSYRYLLIPSRIGRFTIGPVTAEIGGQTYSSKPFTLRVIAAGEEPKEAAEAFLTVAVSSDNPYVGEQIVYTWRFYRRVRVADARITALDFGSLVSEELGEVREYDANYQGVPYRVSELRRALFAQRPGTITIDPAELTCEIAVRGRRRPSIFDFGRMATETKRLRSRSLVIGVKPLPGSPSGFSGLGGQFSVRSSLSKNELRVGESATLEVRVQGSGNIQMMREPTMPVLSGFKIYEDQPSTRIDRSGRSLRGSRTFRKALVPLSAGTVELPALELVYFDPERGKFTTSKTEVIPVQILPGEGTEDLMLTESLNPGAGKVAVRVLADDILPIHRDLRSLKRSRPSRVQQILWGAAAVGPPFSVALLWLLGHRRRRFLANRGLRTRQGAFRQAMSTLRTLADRSDADMEELAGQTALCLRKYVGDRLGMAGEAMTPLEIEGRLLDAKVDPTTAREVRDTLERLEALVFGGDFRRFTSKQLAQSAEQVLQELEAELAGGFRLDGRPSGWFSGRRKAGR